MTKNSRNLSPKQQQAINALLQNSTQRDAAKVVGVNERTLSRWIQEHAEFQAALSEAESAAIADVTRVLAAGAAEAVGVLTDILHSDDATASEKLRAADIWLNRLAQFTSRCRSTAAADAPAIEQPADVVRLLSLQIAEATSLPNDTNRLRAVGYLGAQIIKAFEITELAQRLEALERALSDREE